MSVESQIQNEQKSKLIPGIYVFLGVVLSLVLVGLLVFGVLWLAGNYPAEIEALRDVFVIALALESCLFGFVLIIAVIMLIRLVNTVEFEIKPILQQTNETIGAVRGTTKFVSKNVVRPVAKAGGFLMGVRRGLRVLFGDPRKNLPD